MGRMGRMGRKGWKEFCLVEVVGEGVYSIDRVFR